MPLVTSQEILSAAQSNGYAVGAFNVENMEMAQAAVAAAEELGAPIIIQTTPSTVRYGTLPVYAGIVSQLAHKAHVPVALHLDHGSGFDMAVQAIRQGYTSIMIDGSQLDFAGNVELTRSVVAVARPNGIPVEAELGKVGGKEDDLDGGTNCGYTVPEDAAVFVEQTGISSLAVAIGTAHGIYSGVPKLDVPRLQEIRKLVSIPLVLHGASGLKDEDIQECIAHGICKVNFATELRIAYSEGIRAFLDGNPDAFDPKQYGSAGLKKVKELVQNRMRVCGCVNQY